MDDSRTENEAFVSLVTNNNYANGALVLGHSLRRVNTTRKLALLVTNQVTEPMRQQLSRVWDHIEIVDPLDSGDDANLALLTRPELGITFTKIRCWNLTQFRKCVFMDADTLVLQNCDELFERRELSAVPDIGWPDCFNSGIFVFEPSRLTYEALLQFAMEHGSFDGGDQGLLNSYFNNWATQDIATHLSFIYNMNSNASYTYAPAYKQFGKDVKIVHFIGSAKPWQCTYSHETGQVYMPSYSGSPPHESNFLQLWWDIYVTHVSPDMKQCSGEFPHVHTPVNEPDSQIGNPTPYIPEPNQFYSQRDPEELNHSHDDDPSDETQSDTVSEENLCSDNNTSTHQVTDELALLNLQHDAILLSLPENQGHVDQRTAWQNGQPDYNGRDSFENIKEKLDAVLQDEYRDPQDVPVLV